MIQLFDTHRLSYRNAKLRAWALADKTRRVNFQDYSSEDDTWTSVGTDVITDESGYLFYADGTQKIECLGVEEAAIVDVSLDGGQSYLIQFVIHADHDPTALKADDIYGLTFTNANGVDEVYNPILGPSRLPDYLRRSEYSQGDWREQTVITHAEDIDSTAIPLSNFTHLILVAGGRLNGTGVLTFSLPDNKALRAGQVITIRSWHNISVKFNTVDSPNELYKLRKDAVYILHNNIAKNKLILTDVSTVSYEWSSRNFVPSYSSHDNYIWESVPVCKNRIHETIVYFLALSNNDIAAAAGHINDIHLKVQLSPFKYDTVPLIIRNLFTYNIGASIQVKIWLDFYDGDRYLGLRAAVFDETMAVWSANTSWALHIKYVDNVTSVDQNKLLIVNDTVVEVQTE